jgi:hypothetical protein
LLICVAEMTELCHRGDGIDASRLKSCFTPPRTGGKGRSILFGQIKTLGVATVTMTPIPGTLPVLATALGMGFVGWRRKRTREPMQATV